MTEISGAESKSRPVWIKIAVFAIATVVCTALALWAVVLAPVNFAPGVSGLYIAAAVYVPLALWFGVWGVLAGYLSCVVLGLSIGYSPGFTLLWSLGDMFEGLVPLMAFRLLKVEQNYHLKKPAITYGLTGLLVATFVIAATAMILNLTEVFIATFFVGIAVMTVQALFGDKKTWGMWIIFGVLIASFISGVVGVGAMAGFGKTSMAEFPTALYAWVVGDIIVLATIGTALMVSSTSAIKRTAAYVKAYFS